MKKKVLLALTAGLLLAGAASADVATMRVNYFVPRLIGDFWGTEFENMTLNKSSFQHASFGIHYETFISRGLSLVLGVDIFKRSKAGFYRDWVGFSLEDGEFAFPAGDFYGDFDLSHSVTLSAAPLQVSLKVMPFGRRGVVIPYVGGGANAMLWNIKMQGDMIDFSDEYVYEDEYGEVPVYPVYFVDARESDGLGRISFGWQAFGGLMIPVGDRMTIDVGGQYFSCPAAFENAFKGFEDIDLGGFQLSVGFNYWF